MNRPFPTDIDVSPPEWLDALVLPRAIDVFVRNVRQKPQVEHDSPKSESTLDVVVSR